MKEGNGRGSRESLREQFDGRCNFFYVELPDGTILSYAVEDESKFPVQFGREVPNLFGQFISTLRF